MAEHHLGWNPGDYGKGVICDDGTVHTWVTDSGAPHHLDYVEQHLGLMPRTRIRGFEIEPDGTMRGDIFAKDLTPAVKADSRLKTPQTDDWDFNGDRPGEDGGYRLGSTQTPPDLEPWQPGIYGKGFVVAQPFGAGTQYTVYTWAVHTPEDWSNAFGEPDPADGLPAHADAAEALNVEPEAYFYIDPQGALDYPGADSVFNDIIVAADERLKGNGPAEDFTLGKLSNAEWEKMGEVASIYFKSAFDMAQRDADALGHERAVELAHQHLLRALQTNENLRLDKATAQDVADHWKAKYNKIFIGENSLGVPNDPRWSRTAANHSLQWTPGKPGKGLMILNDQLDPSAGMEVHTWNVSSEHDGDPWHSAYKSVVFGNPAAHDNGTFEIDPKGNLRNHWRLDEEHVLPVQHIVDPNYDERMGFKLGGISRAKLLEQKQTLEAQHPNTMAVHHDFGDGWTVQRPTTYGDVHRTGEMMGNCWSHNNEYCSGQYDGLWDDIGVDMGTDREGLSPEEEQTAMQHMHLPTPQATAHPKDTPNCPECDAENVSAGGEWDGYRCYSCGFKHHDGETRRALVDPHGIPHVAWYDVPAGGVYNQTHISEPLGRHNTYPKDEYVQRLRQYALDKGITHVNGYPLEQAWPAQGGGPKCPNCSGPHPADGSACPQCGNWVHSHTASSAILDGLNLTGQGDAQTPSASSAQELKRWLEAYQNNPDNSPQADKLTIHHEDWRALWPEQAPVSPATGMPQGVLPHPTAPTNDGPYTARTASVFDPDLDCECHDVVEDPKWAKMGLTPDGGFYMEHGVPGDHAWLVDKDGNIVDPTAKQFGKVNGPQTDKENYRSWSEHHNPECLHKTLGVPYPCEVEGCDYAPRTASLTCPNCMGETRQVNEKYNDVYERCDYCRKNIRINGDEPLTDELDKQMIPGAVGQHPWGEMLTPRQGSALKLGNSRNSGYALRSARWHGLSLSPPDDVHSGGVGRRDQLALLLRRLIKVRASALTVKAPEWEFTHAANDASAVHAVTPRNLGLDTLVGEDMLNPMGDSDQTGFVASAEAHLVPKDAAWHLPGRPARKENLVDGTTQVVGQPEGTMQIGAAAAKPGADRAGMRHGAMGDAIGVQAVDAEGRGAADLRALAPLDLMQQPHVDQSSGCQDPECEDLYCTGRHPSSYEEEERRWYNKNDGQLDNQPTRRSMTTQAADLGLDGLGEAHVAHIAQTTGWEVTTTGTDFTTLLAPDPLGHGRLPVIGHDLVEARRVAHDQMIVVRSLGAQAGRLARDSDGLHARHANDDWLNDLAPNPEPEHDEEQEAEEEYRARLMREVDRELRDRNGYGASDSPGNCKSCGWRMPMKASPDFWLCPKCININEKGADGSMQSFKTWPFSPEAERARGLREASVTSDDLGVLPHGASGSTRDASAHRAVVDEHTPAEPVVIENDWVFLRNEVVHAGNEVGHADARAHHASSVEVVECETPAEESVHRGITQRSPGVFADRRPFLYSNMGMLYLGQPGTHHEDIKREVGFDWRMGDDYNWGSIDPGGNLAFSTHITGMHQMRIRDALTEAGHMPDTDFHLGSETKPLGNILPGPVPHDLQWKPEDQEPGKGLVGPDGQIYTWSAPNGWPHHYQMMNWIEKQQAPTLNLNDYTDQDYLKTRRQWQAFFIGDHGVPWGMEDIRPDHHEAINEHMLALGARKMDEYRLGKTANYGEHEWTSLSMSVDGQTPLVHCRLCGSLQGQPETPEACPVTEHETGMYNPVEDALAKPINVNTGEPMDEFYDKDGTPVDWLDHNGCRGCENIGLPGEKWCADCVNWFERQQAIRAYDGGRAGISFEQALEMARRDPEWRREARLEVDHAKQSGFNDPSDDYPDGGWDTWGGEPEGSAGPCPYCKSPDTGTKTIDSKHEPAWISGQCRSCFATWTVKQDKPLTDGKDDPTWDEFWRGSASGRTSAWEETCPVCGGTGDDPMMDEGPTQCGYCDSKGYVMKRVPDTPPCGECGEPKYHKTWCGERPDVDKSRWLNNPPGTFTHGQKVMKIDGPFAGEVFTISSWEGHDLSGDIIPISRSTGLSTDAHRNQLKPIMPVGKDGPSSDHHQVAEPQWGPPVPDGDWRTEGNDPRWSRNEGNGRYASDLPYDPSESTGEENIDTCDYCGATGPMPEGPHKPGCPVPRSLAQTDELLQSWLPQNAEELGLGHSGDDALRDVPGMSVGEGAAQDMADKITPSYVPNKWRRDRLEEQWDIPSGLRWDDPRNSSASR